MSLAFARAEGDKDNWTKISTKNTAKLINFSQHAPENCTNKVIILQEELHIVCNNMQKDKTFCEDDIALSRKKYPRGSLSM